jgi:AraC family transcriptional regulator
VCNDVAEVMSISTTVGEALFAGGDSLTAETPAMPRSQLQPGSFLGRTLKSYRSDHLSLVESQYGSRFRTTTHSHERAFCCLILAGSCTQTYGRRTRCEVKSSLTFHPVGEPHSDAFDESGGRVLHLEFSTQWMNHVREHSLALDQPLEFHSGLPIWLASRLYQELRTPDDTSPLVIEGLALDLAAQFARKPSTKETSRPPHWLARVVELVEARCREQLTVQEMAREAGVHPVHLATVFRRHLRCTPIDFLRRRRIDFAASQLINTQDSLLAISLEAGFGDQSHFCRVFKSVTGMTPTAYRQLFSRQS